MLVILKKVILYSLALVTGLILFIVLCNFWVTRSAKSKMYAEISEVPYNDIALVLGTIKQLRNGRPNLYFKSRIDAAYDLYKYGKVKHFILSGDNSRHGYNEPEDMKIALMDRGVPESAITLDFAGFRTLDSVVRCEAIFQQKKFTIVSQAFHNYRAIFLAQKNGLDVCAYNAWAIQGAAKKREIVRETLARCKAVLDIYILRTKPKFFGEKIDIQLAKN